jgi:hypothetical protein
MKKTIIVIASFIAVVSMSFAFKKADTPKYENLKVLSKNTTKQEMDSIMKHFSGNRNRNAGVYCFTIIYLRGNRITSNLWQR